MKALVHTEVNKFEIQKVAKPLINDSEVLIKVKSVGICGSDVRGMTGKTGRRKPPVIMGHEASGIITEIGKSVTKFKINDRVTFDSTIYCNKCQYCVSGRVNLCEDRKVLGVSCDEYRQDGAMAEYISVPEHILYHIPDNMTFSQAAMIEPVSIALHSVKRIKVSSNDAVAVIGCGMIGLFIVQVLKALGCGKLFAIDIDDRKLKFAKKFGADHIINPSKVDASKKVMSLTHDKGVDVSIEAVGINSTVNIAISSVKKAGRIVLVGNLTPEVNMPLQKIVTKELDIKGSCASAGEYRSCIDLISSGKVDVGSLMSREAPLEEGNHWFHELLENKESLFKIILMP